MCYYYPRIIKIDRGVSINIITCNPVSPVLSCYKTLKKLIRHLQDIKETKKTYKAYQLDIMDNTSVSVMNLLPVISTDDTYVRFEEHNAGSLQFSAYHYHHNREPYYILFIRVPDCDGDKVYIEKIDTHSHRNKYIYDIVMPFAVMESNTNLKKYYDMSTMLVNTGKSIYYDNLGMYSKYLIQTYDTDSDSDASGSDEEDDGSNGSCDSCKTKSTKKPKRSNRNWCISCDCVWKNMRVSSKRSSLNCYYNINPFTYEYKMDTDKKINGFLAHFNNFTKYTSISPAVEKEIIANYNDVPQLTRE